MSENILKIFIEKGFLLDREMLDFLSELEDKNIADEILNKIAIISQKKIITKSLVNENIEKIRPLFFELEDEKKKLVDKYFVNVSISVEVKKERIIEDNIEKIEDNKINLKIISSPIISSHKLEVRNFVRHFRNRYNFMKGLLQDRIELDNLVSIDKITSNRNISIIGLVNKKIITKNNNVILEVEDLTGSAKLLINKNNEAVFEKSKEILLDDVIGFKCSGTRDFMFVNDLFYPDCFLKEK